MSSLCEEEQIVYTKVHILNKEVQMYEAALARNRFRLSATRPRRNIKAKLLQNSKDSSRCGNDCTKPLSPVVNYFREYCEHSSFHGLRYLGEKDLSTFERICWLCFLALSLVACVYLIRQTYIKWETSPVIVTFSGNTLRISEVPFPAVTLCTELKVNNSKFNLTEINGRLDSLTDAESVNLSKLSMICDGIQGNDEEISDAETIKFLVEVGISCDNLIAYFEFMDDDTPEENIFPFLTEEGICCTFNMLSPKDMYTDTTTVYSLAEHKYWKRVRNWTLDGGYDVEDSLSLPVYPHRALGSGMNNGLRITIKANVKEMDKTCSSPEMGFKLALHNPAERPSMSEKYLKLPDNRKLVVALKPSILTTMDNLKGYAPEKRGCFFPEERKLRYFKIYTQDNCEFECKVNLTLTFCGCVTFYMPRDENTKYCGPGKWECVKNISTVARLRTLFRKVSSEKDKMLLALIGESKNCLPACTGLQYDVETSHSNFDKSALPEFKGKRWSLTEVSLFFKDMQFIIRQRSELYGWTDFLANCGGILGFCLGFSVLSLVEIVYFLTVRLACKVTPENTKVYPT